MALPQTREKGCAPEPEALLIYEAFPCSSALAGRRALPRSSMMRLERCARGEDHGNACHVSRAQRLCLVRPWRVLLLAWLPWMSASAVCRVRSLCTLAEIRQAAQATAVPRQTSEARAAFSRHIVGLLLHMRALVRLGRAWDTSRCKDQKKNHPSPTPASRWSFAALSESHLVVAGRDAAGRSAARVGLPGPKRIVSQPTRDLPHMARGLMARRRAEE